MFKSEMDRINKERNCLRSLVVKGFLDTLNELNKKFENIQKNLNQFLETKRTQFPRFYFLSNEDLLEIIGQSKDPRPIVQHIGKMFEGVQSLRINEIGRGNSKTYEIDQLISKEAETVDLQKQIHVDSKVELWLAAIVSEMKEAMKFKFSKYYEANMTSAKSGKFEKDKLMNIIKMNQGQILITMAQMQWTTEVSNALIQLETTG